MSKKRLGELLVETGLLNEENLARALTEQRTRRTKLGEVIVALEMATEEEIAQALSLQLGIPFIALSQTPVEPQAIELISEKVARKHLIIPVAIDQRDLHIAVTHAISHPVDSICRHRSSTPGQVCPVRLVNTPKRMYGSPCRVD